MLTTAFSSRVITGNLDVLLYYNAQSRITDPGRAAAFFNALPHHVSQLAREAALAAVSFPPGPAQNDRRTVEALLNLLQSAVISRQPKIVSTADRFKFTARDCAVLLCSMLRHKGMPARVRCGFARYLDAAILAEHWVCEYWHDWEQRWVLVDPWLLGLSRVDEHVAFSPLDVPRTQFYVAGRALEMCRIWGADPYRFGLAPGMGGLPYVAGQLVRDLACLNRVEMLPWDVWGLGERAFRHACEDDLLLLDKVAAATLAGNDGFRDVLSLYKGYNGLRVPPGEYSLPGEGVAVELVA